MSLWRIPTKPAHSSAFSLTSICKGKAKKLTKDVETPKDAVLGAGIMGGGISYQLAWKGVPVVMKDINDKSLTLGMTEAAKLLNKQLERGKRSMV